MDSARSEAIENGEKRFVRYVEELFPFLEKEMSNSEVDEFVKEELEAALGVRQIPELSNEEQAEGWRLVRSCDDFGLMRMALLGDYIVNDDDRENALSELRILEGDAENKLRFWQQKHGIIA